VVVSLNRNGSMKKLCIPLALAGMVGFAEAAVVVKPLAYEIDGETFEGMLVYDDAVTTPRPGLMMVSNWLGVTERSAEKATPTPTCRGATSTTRWWPNAHSRP
jgi:hypothetical protein